MSNIPSGTVTFLFTDIEGSTQLWEKQPEAMKLALAKHDALLRGIFESHHSYIFKTMGDAFYAAFESPDNALKAALASQQALQKEAWGAAVIKVRMALHCGEVETRDNDYFGQPLNRVARLLSAGHGGQVLISTAIKERVASTLPADISLRDMGERRLKDLIRPEHIFQLIIPNLLNDFPPLKTLDAFRTNLPAQLTSFIGREKEMTDIKSLLTAQRLVTLIGPGGTGKSRLSLQIAADMLGGFPDGVWLLELAPLTDPDLILQTLISTLGLQERPHITLQDQLIEYWRDKKVLLILDNCEHLIAACAQLADWLLRACSNLTMITSSREALGISGETIYRVPSLSVPDPARASLDSIQHCEAVQLFAERARAANPKFNLMDKNTAAVAQICRRLDGIPLALELAAARCAVLSPEQIATRLDDRFKLLTGGSRTALPRQQTLRALIDWSYDMLAVDERVLLRQLAVFAGGWTFETAEAVCSDLDTLSLLPQLVNKSLAAMEEQDGQPRYRLLETIRQYASDKLFESGEAETLRNRHLEYFLVLAEEAAPKLWTSQALEWSQRLEAEQDNFRLALEWSLSDPSRIEKSLRLVNALKSFWHIHSDGDEALHWFNAVIERPETQQFPLAYAQALSNLGILTFLFRNLEVSETLLKQAIESARSLGKAGQLILAESLDFLGLEFGYRKEFARAHQYLEESQALFNAAHSTYGRALTAWHTGVVLANAGETDQAYALYQQALPLFEELGDGLRQSVVMGFLGNYHNDHGDLEGAHGYYRRSLQKAVSIGSRMEIGHSLTALALTTEKRGEFVRAFQYLVIAEKLLLDSGAQNDIPDLNRQFERLRQNLGATLSEELTFTTRALTVEQAIQLALEN